MSVKIKLLGKVVLITTFLWTLFFILVCIYFISSNYKYANELVKNEAVVSIKKDFAYRSWVASHGGVYVPITKRTPPNPYLAHIKNRDVVTNDGQHLTLMNPAYTLSQMMRDYSQLYGTKGHITSKKLLNPKNKPDSWEEKALDIVESTRKPFFEKVKIEEKEYFRYLKPLVTKKDCLKCHEFQGYKIGDIRGGVSVSIPTKPYKDEAFMQSRSEVVIMFFIYILGLVLIFIANKKAKEFLKEKVRDYEQHIYSLVNMIERRDSYTAGHTKRVARYSVLIAKEMGIFDKEDIDNLYRACMLHDIGKVSTPDSILLKPGKLTPLEYSIIKEHVVVSYELLKDVDIYKDIAKIVRYHHERYDGNGYPEGLKGEEIPILSQIMTVADAFDAMTTNRVYKARKSVKKALEELQEFSGKQFNPKIVAVALKALRDVKVQNNLNQRPKNKIERERFAYFYKDLVTGVYNKDYLEFVLSYNSVDEFNIKCGYAVYLHNFSEYNKTKSWAEGDALLKKFADKLREINEDDFIFRIYGDDFIILYKGHFELEKYKKILEEVLADTCITFSYVHVEIHKENIKSINDLEKYI